MTDKPTLIPCRIDPLEPRRLLHGDVNLTFNFQPGTGAPQGTIADAGDAYADRGNGYAYGWSADNRAKMRDRNMVENQLLDTLALMQAGSNKSWELEIANGDYNITIASGDARYRDGVHDIYAENTRVMYGIQSSKKQFLKVTRTVTVSDGKLTIHVGPDAVGAKINYLIIRSVHDDTLPTVTIAAPDDQATEGIDTATVRMTRSTQNLADALTVGLAWSGSAVRKKDDIVSRPSSVTFAAGESTADLTVTPIDDSYDETLETALITLLPDTAHYTLGTPASVPVYITGSEVAPAKPVVWYDPIDANISEAGDGGFYRFHRDGGTLTDSLSFTIAFSGTASAADITPSATTLTFPANASTLDFAFDAVDDTAVEGTESLTITIVPGSSYTVGDSGSLSITILDNDSPAGISDITWSSTTAPPISYSETTSLTLNGYVYLFGGFNGAFVPQKSVYSFDGTAWTTHANSSKAFTHAGHAAISDSVAWFAGGYIGNPAGGQIFGTTDVLTYNALSDTWGTAPALPAARAGGNLVKVGRSVYYFGGENFNRTADMTTMWAINLDNLGAGWIAKTPMPMSRNHASALEVDGKIYALGGQTGFDEGLTAHNDIQIYDPGTDTWSVPTQKLPANRSHTAQSAFYYHGRIVIVTGESAHNVPVNTVWSLDPTTLTTTPLSNFPDARFSAACAIFNDKLYAFGGYKGVIATTAYAGTFVLA